MKIKVALVCCGIIAATSVHAQWIEATSTTTQKLNDICFVDELNGFCVGDNGTFLTSSDKGVTWAQVELSSENHTGVFFYDEMHGFVCAETHIWKTDDGGTTFIDATPEILIHPNTPTILPSSITYEYWRGLAIVTGEWIDTTVTVFTLDSGNSWSIIIPPINLVGKVYDFSIVNENVIYVVVSSKQYKSTDKGVSWSIVRDLPYSLAGKNAFKIFDESGKGYAACGYGTKFVSIYDDAKDSLVQNENIIDPHSFSFLDTANGYWLKSNKLYQTHNRGLTKTVVGNFEFFDDPNKWFVHFTDHGRGFLYGQTGQIFYADSISLSNPNLQSTKKKIEIYPHPASTQLKIESPDEVVEVKVINANGQVLKVFNKQVLYDVKDLPNGIYVFCVKTRSYEEFLAVTILN